MSGPVADPADLLAAMRISLAEGGRFLAGRIAPCGPVLAERNLSYVHKSSWGMYAAGVDHDTIARLLDWIQTEAFQANRDFYFPEEPPEAKDFQRVYRTLIFGRVAVWIDHPVIRQPSVLDRILQYQHPDGGVFHFIGDDPKNVQAPPTLGTLNTTFFGQLMLALDLRDPALAAGRWVRRWIQANRPHLDDGRLYTQMTPEGQLVTDVGSGESISKLVDTVRPKQEFWNIGTAVAYLADLYQVMRTRWDEPEEKAEPFLQDAIKLLRFECKMPLDTYLWPSKCKVGWGAAELLRVLVQRGAEAADVATAYRIGERVAMFTFMDNQLPDGGWPVMHYPLRDDIPELAFSYKPLKGHVRVPPAPIPGSQTIYLPREEISGEFLGELKTIEQAVAVLLKSRGQNKHQGDQNRG